ncbi:MAG TPA: BREX system Lon protease-like protein BrxL [Planctomycetes bacterium]|nr:BREX system Lon protease-like protein BrxL [Planctomycetota bacterium]
MNDKLQDTFRGKVVNKRLTINTGVDEFPRYVVEYLIDNYCTEDNFQEDLQQVVRRLRENFVHGAEAEKIRHVIRETRNHNIIASLEVRLQETEDKYWGTISAINESFVNVTESLVRQYPMLLSGGMWGTITLTYDETEVHNKKIRPFKVVEFTPFQISVIDVEEYCEKRAHFSDSEWLDILVNSIGLNPEGLSRRQKLLYMLRLVPLVEANCNFVELAPRETGKTYLYRNASYYCHVLSGGKATPAGLFINNATGRVGVVGSRDAVVFDEIANTDFTDPKALVSIMQGYMQDGKFSRGKKEILAFASIVLVGNIDVQGNLPHEKYYHLFEPFPDFLQVEAFIDRLHCYTPGWEIPKIGPNALSQDYGFITDYFCEIMHELRRKDAIGAVKQRYQLVDTSDVSAGITGRDIRAVDKVLSGLLKLLYPHGDVEEEQLAELLALAVEGRQRVRNQLHLMAPGEYGPVVLGARLTESGRVIVPSLADANRQQQVTLPPRPSVGEVIGLAVIGDDRGCIQHFEMQASKGTGRIVALGSMQRVMKESVTAARQFVRTHAKDLGLPPDWQENFDVAVLATMMGVPKEGPSAGITIVTGIVSALTERPVRNDLAMTGEITIKGKVLGVGGVIPKIQAAIEAGCREVVVPKENEHEVHNAPDYMKDKIKVTYAANINDVLSVALLEAK